MTTLQSQGETYLRAKTQEIAKMFGLESVHISSERSNGKVLFNVTEHEGGDKLVCFGFGRFPNNRNILIVISVFVATTFRGQGVGQRFSRYREEIARLNNRTVLVSTVRNDNHNQKHIMEKTGYKALINIPGYRSPVGATLWGKEI